MAAPKFEDAHRMARFRPVEKHVVFPVECKGDTVIVFPTGAATSFTGAELQGELNQVLKLFDNPRLRNAIVDLSAANYFGSEIVGALNHLCSFVRDRGGRFAVCAASPDMREGLHLMKLDTVWPMFATRRQAEKAIVSRRMSETLQTSAVSWAVLLFAVILAATGVIWIYFR
jgi:anti-anti-sigma factor